MNTDRLIIRRFENNKADLNALYQIMSDVEVNKYLPWFPLRDEDEAKDFFNDRILPRYVNNEGYYLAVCLKEDNIPIGYITVSADENHDFGYGLREEFWSKGIITEASKRVIQELRDSGWKYITATHDIQNIGSGKVMSKLGMTYKYTYIEQWQPKDIQVTFRMYQLNFDGVDRTYMEYWNRYEEHFIEDIIKVV